MPVVQLSYDRLSQLTGAPVDVIRQRLPHLGLDIEYEDGDTVHVEYSPNRPDYSTEYGMAIGMQGILGICTGMVLMDTDTSAWTLVADDSVRDIRGAITGILATGGTLDDHTIRQIITMQEDIHQGMGRRRKKVAIGLHDASTLKPPILYGTVGEGYRFTPLGGKEMSIHDILQNTEQGRQYGKLLKDRFPIISDSAGTVASMPPVINSDATVLNDGTSAIFVDITGHHVHDVEDALAVVCVTLQAAGFHLEKIQICGAGNRTPPLESRNIIVNLDTVNGILGLGMTVSEAARYARMSRLDAHTNNNDICCTIPPYRFDIFGPMDVIEEIALGYGIDRMRPAVPEARRRGRPHSSTVYMSLADRIMTGLGYTQVMSPALTSEGIAAQANMVYNVKVSNPKSIEHAALRASLLPGLLDILGRNIHQPYPHRIYETGWVFDGITESLRLSCMTAHRNASYSEAKSVLYAMLHRGAAILDIATPRADLAPFMAGRSAHVSINDTNVGMIGEISPDILQSFRLRGNTRAAAFELDIGLIFGGHAQ